MGDGAVAAGAYRGTAGYGGYGFGVDTGDIGVRCLGLVHDTSIARYASGVSCLSTRGFRVANGAKPDAGPTPRSTPSYAATNR